MTTTTPAKPVRQKKKKRIGRRIVAALLILALLGGAAYGVWRLFFAPDERVAMTGKTTFGALDRSIEGSGTTVPAETLAITPVSRATIEAVHVKAGDMVEVGQLLYTQDDSEIDEQIADLEEQIADYESEIVDTETTITELELSIEEYYEKIADYRADLAELEANRLNLSVRAPYAGTISGLRAEVGQNVNSGATLATLTDTTVMELTQYFSYGYAEQIKVGMSAVVAVGGQMLTVEGKVSEISFIERTTDEGMKCFEVIVTLTNPGSLQDGGSASAYLLTDAGQRLYPSIEGTLAFRSTEAIEAEASGELLQVKVKEYDRVAAGQVLFVIDGESYDNQKENLEKQITSTEKQITSAEKQIESNRKKITQTEEKIETARESIADAEENRENFAMKSEIAGKVMYCNIEAGDTPNMMSSALTIYNMETMTISVNFDELDVDYISEGTTVTITRTSAERNNNYTGTITYLSPEASSSNGVATFAATIEIDSKGELSSGVSVTYRIGLGDSEEGVLAPVAALKSHEDAYYLYVKADARPANAVDLVEPTTEIPEGFWAVPVEVGQSNANYVRIVSGVEADVEVFTRYRNNAPTGGNTTSQNGEDEEFNFEDMFGSGGMPSFGGEGGMPSFGQGGQGGMPSFGGNSGSSGSRPSGGQSGGGMPGGRG